MSGELGRIYRDGESIFHEGETGDNMYVVQSGRVKIARQGGAKELVIARLQAGEIFGEMALFDRQPRSASALADGEARVLSIDRKKLFASISRDPTLVLKILEAMSGRIRKLNEEFSRLRESRLESVEKGLSVDETCAYVLEQARSKVRADNGSIMLLDADGKHLTVHAGFGAESASKVRLKEGEGVAGHVIRNRKAELVNNAALDDRFKPGSVEVRSLLCAPLMIGEHVFGVINLSSLSENLFTVEDLKAIHLLSVYASMTLHSALSLTNLKFATEAIMRQATVIGM